MISAIALLLSMGGARSSACVVVTGVTNPLSAIEIDTVATNMFTFARLQTVSVGSGEQLVQTLLLIDALQASW